MNQKHYDAIAEIICGTIATSIECKMTKREIATKLADYFERENKERLERAIESFPIKSRKITQRDRDYLTKGIPKFNREQFLKECGIHG